jgi:hypothetical protein
MIHASGIGVFVPGSFTIPAQPAGIGSLRDFVPARFTLPAQPAGIGELGEVGGLDAFTPAHFTLPQNPIYVDEIHRGSIGDIEGLGSERDVFDWEARGGGLYGLGDCKCGGGGTCVGCSGMSGILDDVQEQISRLTSGDIPWGTIAMAGGGLLLLSMMFGGGGRARRKGELYRAKSEYYKKVGEIKRKHSVRGRIGSGASRARAAYAAATE